MEFLFLKNSIIFLEPLLPFGIWSIPEDEFGNALEWGWRGILGFIYELITS